MDQPLGLICTVSNLSHLTSTLVNIYDYDTVLFPNFQCVLHIVEQRTNFREAVVLTYKGRQTFTNRGCFHTASTHGHSALSG